MQVTIILPGSGRYPSGGFRVIYEHANRLVDRGHSVHLVHATSLESLSSIVQNPRGVARFARDALTVRMARRRWFTLDTRVRVSICLRPTASLVGRGDVVMATGWRTARFVGMLPPTAGHKAYFIQSYEIWDGPKEDVDRTWTMPIHKIVIAQWLKDLATEFGEEADLVVNAIDHEFFQKMTEDVSRPQRTVLFQSLERPLKGSADAVSALNLLRANGVPLDIICFGRIDPVHLGLSKPYCFLHDPTQSELRDAYRQATVYLNPSHIEGWGLTIAEAAASGAALVVSDIGGHRELAQDGVNALLFPPHDIERMAAQVESILNKTSLRQRLVRRASEDVRQFNWSRASDQMEATLHKILEYDRS